MVFAVFFRYEALGLRVVQITYQRKSHYASLRQLATYYKRLLQYMHVALDYILNGYSCAGVPLFRRNGYRQSSGRKPLFRNRDTALN